MILYYGNNLKSGLKVIFENAPYSIESVEFVKPGKGQVFSRVKLKNFLTKQLIEKTFRSTDYLNSANVLDITLVYLYNDNKFWYFMNSNTFEQFMVEKSVIQNKSKWMVEQNNYVITFWNDNPIDITINNFVELQVMHFNPKVKPQLMTHVKNAKFCQLNTKAILKVPLFIQIGDIIKIDTRTGKYISRINK